MKSPVALACLAAVSVGAAHAENRELGAHEHGSGALNIAIEGQTVLMELEAPGADIVGFEYEARSAEDRDAIETALATLREPLTLFTPSADAGCVVAAASVELVAAGDNHDHDDHGHKDAKHEEHAHDEHKHDDHAHDEHKHDNDHDHDKHADDHDGHAHEEHADEAEGGHTEFHAEYALTCADPAALGVIDFAYFERFPNALELDVQLISATGAAGFEVERDDPRLDLSGTI